MAPTPPDRSGDTARQPDLAFQAHRGIFVPGDHHTSNAGLGVHWSADRKIAEEMGAHASQNNAGMGTHPNDRIVMYNADVPISSVETDFNKLYDRGVLSPLNLNENTEKEIPLKKGAIVHLKSSSSSTRKRTRTRTYTPPRERKA